MIALLALAVAPAALALIYIYRHDLIAKEPTKALVKSFLAGAILVFGAAFLCEWGLQYYIEVPESLSNPYFAAFDSAILQSAIPKEFFIFIVLYWLVWNSMDFDENFDGIVYTVFISMGFVCSNNCRLILTHGAITDYIHAFSAIPGHFFFAIIMGYYFSLARFNPNKRRSYLAKSLFLPILVHGIYDYILFLTPSLFSSSDDTAKIVLGALFILFFVITFKLWQLGLNRIKELKQLDAEMLEKTYSLMRAPNTAPTKPSQPALKASSPAPITVQKTQNKQENRATHHPDMQTKIPLNPVISPKTSTNPSTVSFVGSSTPSQMSQETIEDLNNAKTQMIPSEYLPTEPILTPIPAPNLNCDTTQPLSIEPLPTYKDLKPVVSPNVTQPTNVQFLPRFLLDKFSMNAFSQNFNLILTLKKRKYDHDQLNTNLFMTEKQVKSFAFDLTNAITETENCTSSLQNNSDDIIYNDITKASLQILNGNIAKLQTYQIEHSTHDVIPEFYIFEDLQSQKIIAFSLRMPVEQAKDLATFLSQKIAEYEQTYGTIITD